MVSIESVSVACFCALCECIFAVCGQFLYGGCICAYTMRESIPLCGGLFLCGGCICAYTMREHPSVVVGVDGGV